LSLFGVSIDAESIVGFLSGQMDSLYCHPDAFAMLKIVGEDVDVNDVLISAVSKMMIPFAVGSRAMPILAKCTPARRGVGIVHREPQFVPLRIVHYRVMHGVRSFQVS
jgi:hypothetical protein